MTTRRILIIDDDEDIREVTRVSLEIVGGWQVETAASGADGLAMAARLQPDAILLDVMMPDMDGPATWWALQADAATSRIPVILLTAKVASSDRLAFANLGVAAIIAKPFDPLQITNQVEAALGWA